MAEFDIVDLTIRDETQTVELPLRRSSSVSGQGVANRLGSIDTATVAAELEALRQDLTAHIKTDKSGLRLATLTVKLTLSAEGKVAFVARGAAEACIEVTFSSAIASK